MSEELVLTIPEAAKLLRVSRNFGYELARQGKLPVIKLGRRLLVSKVALERLIEGGIS